MELHGIILLAGNVFPVSLDALFPAFIFLYIGPETLLPLASFLASLLGLVLMFWRYIVKTVRKFIRKIFRRGAPVGLDDDLIIATESIATGNETAAPLAAAPVSEHADAEPVNTIK